MRTIGVNSLGVGLSQLHSETLKWLREAHFYLDEIELFQNLIHKKSPYNEVEIQISRDIDLNLNAMADKIHKDTLKRLTAHESSLVHLMQQEEHACDQEFREKHTFIYKQIADLKQSIKHLKEHVHKFMLQKKFGESPYECKFAS